MISTCRCFSESIDLIARQYTGSPSYLIYLLGEMRVRPETVSTSVVSRRGGIAEALTARELEILRLIAAGMRNQEIADRLFISLHTVKPHIANVYGKLGGAPH